MKYVKEYGISLLKFLGFLLGGSFIMSLLYYFLLPTKVIQMFLFLYMVLLFFFFGFGAGKKSKSKGLLAGLKIGILFLLVLFFFNLVFFRSPLKLARLWYSLILLLFSSVGATIGINRKKE